MSIKISLPILKSQKELKNTTFYQRNIESIEYKYHCEVCGDLCSWSGSRKQFNNHKIAPNALKCKKCLLALIAEKSGEQKRNMSPEAKNRMKEKYRKTCLEKYGVPNATYLPDHDDKVKKTCLEKYGVEYPNQCRDLRAGWRGHSRTIDGIPFDSEWEFIFYSYCKLRGHSIKREPCTLTYEFQSKSHKYFPDFEVDGRLYELKNSWLLKRMRNPNTVENAKLKCIELNNVILITRPIIDYMRSFLQERNF